MKLVSLSSDERKELLTLARQVKDIKTGLRIRAFLALDAGYLVKQTADILLIDEDIVTQIKKKYEKRQFWSDWLADAPKGYKGKLTRKQETGNRCRKPWIDSFPGDYCDRRIICSSFTPIAYY